MRVPTRRADKIAIIKPDPYMTRTKFLELQNKLHKLLHISRPREIEEVKRLAMMGDFSENAGYQLAKGRLRSINRRILEIEDLLKRAEIIEPNPNNGTVELGSSVTIQINNQTKKYSILGSAETNPTAGVISHNSPIGMALLGHRVGENIKIQLANKTMAAKIIKIE